VHPHVAGFGARCLRHFDVGGPAALITDRDHDNHRDQPLIRRSQTECATALVRWLVTAFGRRLVAVAHHPDARPPRQPGWPPLRRRQLVDVLAWL